MRVKSLLELGEKEHSALHKVAQLLADMEVHFIDRFTESQRIGELDNQLDPDRLGRRLQAEIMRLRAFAQRDVTSTVVYDLAEDMALSLAALPLEALRINDVVETH